MNFKKYVLSEMARSTDSKLVSYEENDKEIRAILATSKAGYVTRLGNELDEVAKALKEYKAKEAKLKAELRNTCDSLFDEADSTITKFLVTQQVIITVGSVNTSEKKTLDMEGFLNEISNVCGLGVDALQAIQKQFTKIEQSPAREASIRVKKLQKEAFNSSNIIQKIKEFSLESVKVIRNLFSNPMEKRLKIISDKLKLQGINFDYEAVLKQVER